MKKLIYIIIPVFICSISVGQGFTIYEGDTINTIDEKGLKQGFWKIFNKTKKLPNYSPDQVVEEGNYENSRKQGIWKRFFPNGKIKDEINFVNSRPNGYYKTYYDNGEVQEEGTWKNNRNTGSFKRYYENGQIAQDFTFNTTGKREGKQTYYYENGQKMIEGDWAGGKEAGVITEYYDDGSLKAQKAFNNGVIDAAKTKTYESKNPVKDKVEEEINKAPDVKVTVSKDETVNIGTFNGNGKHKMYNKNKQLSKDGVFKNYRLMEGKWYKYDDNGILVAIEIYKKGRYIGDAPLPDSK